jgi:hypothetical protein
MLIGGIALGLVLGLSSGAASIGWPTFGSDTCRCCSRASSSGSAPSS